MFIDFAFTVIKSYLLENTALFFNVSIYSNSSYPSHIIHIFFPYISSSSTSNKVEIKSGSGIAPNSPLIYFSCISDVSLTPFSA